MKTSICIPGSKSYTNRALVLAALTKGRVVLQNPLYSEDTQAMIHCLQQLGLKIDIHSDQMIVESDIGEIREGKYHLFVQDSGTTARFLLALCCIVPGIKTIAGNCRLQQRPIRDLVDALRQLGAKIVYYGQEGELPIQIFSSTLLGGNVCLKTDQSSQFASALLLISPYLPKGLKIELEGELVSKPYIEMTIACMEEWGVKVCRDTLSCVPQVYQKEQYTIEGDFSSAAYFFAIAALTKSSLTVQNLNPNSLQADRKLLEILVHMGNEIFYEENQISIQGKQILPMKVDMKDCPDQVMTVAVLAAFAKGITHICGIRTLRFKETDRVLALKNELAKMGIRTEDTEDTLTIYGGTPRAAEIDTYNDHRIAMAFAVASSYLPGMIIRHPEVVRKTFPGFWEYLKSL